MTFTFSEVNVSAAHICYIYVVSQKIKENVNAHPCKSPAWCSAAVIGSQGVAMQLLHNVGDFYYGFMGAFALQR